MIQRDLTVAYTGRFDTRENGPAADLFVVTLAADVVQVKGLFLGLKIADTRDTSGAVVLNENG